MIDVVFGLVFIFFVFFAIGVGPTFFSMKNQFSIEKLIIFSPVLGYVITVIVGVYLTLLNIPVGKWFWIYTFIAISASFLFFKFSNISLISSFKENKSLMSMYAFVFLLLVLPMLVGGINFTVLRGNGTDAFNYMTMAGFLQHEPLSLLTKASLQELLDKHASYPLAKQLLTERWATSLILAYFSSLVKLPLYRLDYAYNLLFFWMSSGIFYLLIKEIINKSWLIILLAIVCSTGFWAQLILDTRAMSQMSVLPVILMCSYLFVKTDELKSPTLFIVSLLLACVVLLYVELVPLVFVSFGLYTFLTIIHEKNLKVLFRALGLIFIFSILLLIPAFNFLLVFLKKQMHFAVANINNWHLAYFSWLYDYNIMGFWGLGPFTIHPVFIKLGMVFSVLMTIPLIICLLTSFFQYKNRYIVLSSCFALSSLALFSFLYSKGQLWAAGKVLSFVYPFFILCFLGGIELLKHTRLQMFAKVILIAWVISQIFLALVRIPLAHMQKDFPHYVYGHGYYRQHDFFDKPFRDVACRGIIIDIKDGWLEEYFNFVLGWKYPLLNLHGVHDRENHLIGQQQKIGTYDCLLQKIAPKNNLKSKVIAHNNEFELIHLDN
jgi:hypothetical protein